MASEPTNPTDVSSKDGLMSGSSSGAGPNSPTSLNSTPDAKAVENLKIALQPLDHGAKDAKALRSVPDSVSPNPKSSEEVTEEDSSSPGKNGQLSDNNNSKSASQANSKSQDSAKKYYCPTCNQGFTRKHNMISHELIHSQMKPHVCPICNLTFRRIHDLKRHEKLHSGEKPFQCYQCGKRFARPDSLTRHQHSPNACSGMYKMYAGASSGERGESSVSSAQQPQRPALPPLGLIRTQSGEYVGGGRRSESHGHWPNLNPQSYVYSTHNAGPGFYTTTTTTTTTTRHIDGSDDSSGESRDGHGHRDEHQRAVERFKKEHEPTSFAGQNYPDQKPQPDTRIPQDIRLQQDPQLQHDPRFTDGRFRQDLRTPSAGQEVKAGSPLQSRKRSLPFGDRNDSPFPIPYPSMSPNTGGRASGQTSGFELRTKMVPLIRSPAVPTPPQLPLAGTGKPQGPFRRLPQQLPQQAPQQVPQQPRPQYLQQPQYGGYINHAPRPTLHPSHGSYSNQGLYGQGGFAGHGPARNQGPSPNPAPPPNQAQVGQGQAPTRRSFSSSNVVPGQSLPPQSLQSRDSFQGESILYNQPRNTSMYQYPPQQEYISLSRYQDLVAYT